MNKEELISLLKERGMENSCFLPEEFTMNAIIGFSSFGNIIYDRYKLTHCYAVEYAKQDGFNYDELDDEKQGEYEVDGMEWIDYNVLGSISGIRTMRDGTIPIIVMDPIEDFI